MDFSASDKEKDLADNNLEGSDESDDEQVPMHDYVPVPLCCFLTNGGDRMKRRVRGPTTHTLRQP